MKISFWLDERIQFTEKANQLALSEGIAFFILQHLGNQLNQQTYYNHNRFFSLGLMVF